MKPSKFISKKIDGKTMTIEVMVFKELDEKFIDREEVLKMIDNWFESRNYNPKDLFRQVGRVDLKELKSKISEVGK